MYKRRRTDNSTSTSNRRAVAAAIAIRKRWPLSQYGVSHSRRGAPENVARFGSSFRSANSDQRSARRSVGYYGRGAYWGKSLGSWLGGKAGAYAGGLIGAPDMGYVMGSKVGSKLGDWGSDEAEKAVGKFFGRGSYYSQGNHLINPPGPFMKFGSPLNETGDLIIGHREHICAIKQPTATNFTLQLREDVVGTVTSTAFVLNPGIAYTFPWLSQIAKYFEEYEFLQLIFEFRSMVTDGNTSAKGVIMMATQYNALNATPSTQQTMENLPYSNSGKVTDNLIHGIECDPTKVGGNAIEYVRTGTGTAPADLNTYDHGNFYLAATGGSGTAEVIGNLYVTYSVKLSKPRMLVS